MLAYENRMNEMKYYALMRNYLHPLNQTGHITFLVFNETYRENVNHLVHNAFSP